MTRIALGVIRVYQVTLSNLFEPVQQLSQLFNTVQSAGAGLNKLYGRGRWRKLKGLAVVRLDDGTMYLAEIHWYEAHGIGKKEIKIKRLLEQAG